MPRCPRRLLQAGFSLIVLLALAGPAVVTPAPALAATVTWTGTDGACPGGSPWSTAACWNNGAGPVPSNGDAVVFAQTGNNRPNNCDLSRTLNSITFSNTGVPSNLVNVGG